MSAIVPSDLELMRLHIEALYVHDERGRMVRSNEHNDVPAPRFFLGRTEQGIVWRVRHDVRETTADALTAACAMERAGDEPLVAPYGATPYEAILAGDAPLQQTWSGPAYRLPETLPDAPDVVRITPDNAALLKAHLAAWSGDDVVHCQPMLATVVDGHAVAICGSVRITPSAHEAGVETVPDFRCRGYARQAVAAWARAVRDLDRLPLYSTSWQNLGSRALAASLGAVRYGSDISIA
jgi:RimJ/RimL family protein N-acetyltransferase